ncbi:MAG: hypothetical protein ACF8OB_05895 [Phycisphaeraceae bacterium JB051]
MLLMVFGAMLGCQFKGDGVTPNNQAAAIASDSQVLWQPTPHDVRIYPSSRFILTEQRPALEARVELKDEMGDSLKAAGVFHLELLKETGARRQAMQEKLYSWDVPLNSIVDQQSYFDSVTRTYRFVLRLDREIAPDDQLVLAITFKRPDGALLKTQAVLGPDGVRFGH